MDKSHVYVRRCSKCGHETGWDGKSAGNIWPVCDGRHWNVDITVEEKMLLPMEELDATATDSRGRLIAERIEKADRITTASLAADAGQPARLATTRAERIDGFVEEGVAAAALVKALNADRGTQYAVAVKAAEDNDYADRVLQSTTDDPKRINVQVRHLDTQIAAALGRDGKYRGERTADQWIKSITEGIACKAQVDAGQKAQTILLLLLPGPLGAMTRQHLTAASVDSCGFREVWVAPFHEASFRVA